MSPAGPGKRSGCHHALAVADPMPAGLHISGAGWIRPYRPLLGEGTSNAKTKGHDINSKYRQRLARQASRAHDARIDNAARKP